MKVSELEGALLDFWVAKADGAKRVFLERDMCSRSYGRNGKLYFSPSTDWSQGGPIIEREGITVCTDENFGWSAYARTSEEVKKDPQDGRELVLTHGPTPLIAAMRAFVSSKFGDEVE